MASANGGGIHRRRKRGGVAWRGGVMASHQCQHQRRRRNRRCWRSERRSQGGGNRDGGLLSALFITWKSMPADLSMTVHFACAFLPLFYRPWHFFSFLSWWRYLLIASVHGRYYRGINSVLLSRCYRGCCCTVWNAALLFCIFVPFVTVVCFDISWKRLCLSSCTVIVFWHSMFHSICFLLFPGTLSHSDALCSGSDIKSHFIQHFILCFSGKYTVSCCSRAFSVFYVGCFSAYDTWYILWYNWYKRASCRLLCTVH